MADGATTFVPESIDFNGTGLGGVNYRNSGFPTAVVNAAKHPDRGVFQKLSHRSDGNAASLNE